MAQIIKEDENSKIYPENASYIPFHPIYTYQTVFSGFIMCYDRYYC